MYDRLQLTNMLRSEVERIPKRVYRWRSSLRGFRNSF